MGEKGAQVMDVYYWLSMAAFVALTISLAASAAWWAHNVRKVVAEMRVHREYQQAVLVFYAKIGLATVSGDIVGSQRLMAAVAETNPITGRPRLLRAGVPTHRGAR